MNKHLRRSAALLALALAVSPAAAQQKFQLTDKGFQKVAEPDPATPEGQLYQFRKLIAQGKPDEAAAAAKAWIKSHPNHPLLPEAHLIRGDALTAEHEYYKALFEYEELIRAYPDSPHFDLALEREMKIAQTFAAGVKRKLWGMRILPAQSEAEELFIRIQERSPGSKLAEQAGIELADYYYRSSDMVMAAEAYNLFLKSYPHSQWREHAMRRQVLANLATFKGPEFDATGLIEAQRRLNDFQTSFPAASEQLGGQAMLTRIDESLAQRDLLAGLWYEKVGKARSAEFVYLRLLKDHPGSAAARQALGRLHTLEPSQYGPPPNLDEPPTPATGKGDGR